MTDSASRRMHRYGPEGSRIGRAENIALTSGFDMMEKAFRNGEILEGIATMCDSRDLSLRVDFGRGVGIIPREETVYQPDGRIKDIAIITRVGKPVCFKITSLSRIPGDPAGRFEARLSRRAAQVECTEMYISALCPGDIIPARVTHLEPFGAFLDIGCGIVSLMTVDAVSVSRIAHPAERLAPGDRLRAVVRSIDRESGRINMSLRELLGTWEENAALFRPFQTVAGIVRSIEDYGIFVELMPNLAGLSELRPNVSVGDSCCAYIKSINPKRMKIKLVLIETSHDRHPVGFRYFVGEDVRHMDAWRYSPQDAVKVTETVFG